MEKAKEFALDAIVVTGASSGIGQACAALFGKEGARVVVGARNVDRLEETVRRIREAAAAPWQ